MNFELLPLGLSTRCTGLASKDGLLVVATWAGQVVAWDGKQARKVFEGAEGSSLAVAFSPDGTLALACFGDEPCLITFDAALAESSRVPFEPEDAYRDVVSMVWLDAERVALASEESKCVTVVEVKSGKTSTVKGAKVVYPLSVGPGVLFAGGQKQLQAWALPGLGRATLTRPANRSPIDCVSAGEWGTATLSSDDLVLDGKQHKAANKPGPGFWGGSRAKGALFVSEDGARVLLNAWSRLHVVELKGGTISATVEGREGKDFTHCAALGDDLLALDMGGGALLFSGALDGFRR